MASLSSATGRITFPLIIVIAAACFGNNFHTYNMSVISNLVDLDQRFMNESFHLHYGAYLTEYSISSLWSFSTAAYQLGCLTGSTVTRFLADQYGRRKGLMILAVVTAVGSVCEGLAKTTHSFELFITGRFTLGFSSGANMPLLGMFISEIAPVRYRGACGTVQQLFMGLGTLAAYILTLSPIWGNEEGWPLAVSVPPLVATTVQFLVLLCFAHESPRELVLTRNDPVRGLAALKFYQGEKDAEKALMAVRNERPAVQEKEEEFRFLDLFRKPEIRRPLAIAVLIVYSCQTSGMAAVYAYSMTMFTQAGLASITSQYASIGLGVCTCLASLATTWLVERAGRKPTLVLGLLISNLTLLALTVSLVGGSLYNWPNAALAAIPCLYIFQIGYSFANSVRLVAPAELFPQKVRASGMTVVYICHWLIQCAVVFGYLPVAELMGVCYSYVPFILSVTLAIVLVAVFMPETKGKSVEQVAAIFTVQSAMFKL